MFAQEKETGSALILDVRTLTLLGGSSVITARSLDMDLEVVLGGDTQALHIRMLLQDVSVAVHWIFRQTEQ